MRHPLNDVRRIAFAVSVVCALAIATGCFCPECPECKECPSCPGGVHVNVGVPVPGPIIDTTGSGGTLTHRYNEVAITGSSGDTNVIDTRLISEVSSSLLVDSSTFKVWGLVRDEVVTVTFSDGNWYKVKIGDTSQPLEWTCSQAGGATNVTLVAGSSGQLPDCVTLTGGRTVSSVTTASGHSGDILAMTTSH